MGRRGLVLVELVVVAIIMLLIAITLPVMHQARLSARRASCGSQVKALALGSALYGQENGGWLPPGPKELSMGGRWARDPDRGSPLELFGAERIGSANLSSQIGWYGQGLLWKQGAVNDGRFFYCPELESRGWGYALAWPQQMSVAPDRAGEKAVVTGSYIYRGGYASQAGTSDGPRNSAWDSGGEPLFADSPLYGAMWHGGGYTVGYLGGQVEFRTFAAPVVTGLVVGPLWDAVGPGAASAPATGKP